MIKIDFESETYICPFCGHAQAYLRSHDRVGNGAYKSGSPIPEEYQESSFAIHTFRCSNSSCQKISVTAINRTTDKQIDLVPQVTMRHYPEYIPEQIRQDYEEANMILEASPKAAATLLRRCLQGMIHNYWEIHEKNLNAEISKWALDNGNRPLTQQQKDMLKAAIDECRTLEELFRLAIASSLWG